MTGLPPTRRLSPAVNLYGILGLTVDASPETIRQTYKKLAILYHPDKCPQDPHGEQFKDIAQAYRILSDPEQRALYDTGKRRPSVRDLHSELTKEVSPTTLRDWVSDLLRSERESVDRRKDFHQRKLQEMRRRADFEAEHPEFASRLPSIYDVSTVDTTTQHPQRTTSCCLRGVSLRCTTPTAITGHRRDNEKSEETDGPMTPVWMRDDVGSNSPHDPSSAFPAESNPLDNSQSHPTTGGSPFSGRFAPLRASSETRTLKPLFPDVGGGLQCSLESCDEVVRASSRAATTAHSFPRRNTLNSSAIQKADEKLKSTAEDNCGVLYLWRTSKHNNGNTEDNFSSHLLRRSTMCCPQNCTSERYAQDSRAGS
jgi:curved DNA-binding protein CbpA